MDALQKHKQFDTEDGNSVHDDAEAELSEVNQVSDDNDSEGSEPEVEPEPLRRSARNRRPPDWLRDHYTFVQNCKYVNKSNSKTTELLHMLLHQQYMLFQYIVDIHLK